VDRQLFRDDENLVEFRVDPDQLGDAIARRRRRQIDDAAVEAVPRLHALAYAVIDGNIPQRRFQHLAASSRRRAEHDVAAGIDVPDGSHVLRLPAQDVEDADPVLTRRDLC
jgi:hypothetical protein